MSTSIPALHVSTKSRVSGFGEVLIQSRIDGSSTGKFSVRLGVSFDPGVDEYPTGTISIISRLSDGSKGTFNALSIELINSHGKHNPTVFITGRCNDSSQPDAKGCRFWLMIANNKTPNQQGTPDVVSFTIHDRNGQRVAYGSGPVTSGDFTVLEVFA